MLFHDPKLKNDIGLMNKIVSFYKNKNLLRNALKRFFIIPIFQVQ